MTIAVVVPVFDGARWLRAVLDAVRAQAADEMLVIDSGSTDGSTAIAEQAGARVHRLAPGEFGHGRTRNLGAELTSSDLICFLTQDATPVPGWLDAYRAAFAADARLGAAFGPHLPRPETSPMIARELEAFFAGDGPPLPWLSNVNACYRRACWASVRFADVRYSEDQAFARALQGSPWRLRYVPAAGVLHAHDYGVVDFWRRYFDEYRGLRHSAGHVEPWRGRALLREVRAEVGADRRWLRAQGRPAAPWLARSVVHHAGRRVFAPIGSRAARLPAGIERRLSLEGTTSAALAAAGAGAPPGAGTHVPARGPLPWDPVLDVARDGAVPLLAPVPGQAERERLHVAVVIPHFRRGSGGHSTIYNLLTRLEDRGHTVSTWLHDPLGMARDEWPSVVRGNLREFFRPPRGPVFKGFAGWHGADVALATGWETVHPVLRLDHCRARAYLVQDHEPEFFATSAQRLWAEQGYHENLPVIAASPWLAELARAAGATLATHFDLAVDQAVYRPRPVPRRQDTVIFYARDATARRAVPLGLLALAELHRRRPGLRYVLFGDLAPAHTPFPHEHLGIATPERLSWAYSEATVGLSLSLTNYSLIPQEMLACGLPVVELAGRSLESVYGADGPIELAPADPLALADALERLLDDPALRERRAAAGRAFVADRTWEHATDQVEAGLRAALAAGAATDGPGAGDAEAIRAAAATPGGSRHARAVPLDPQRSYEVTDRLFARLADDDVAAIAASADAEQADLLQRTQGSEPERRRMLLRLAVANAVGGVAERLGLALAWPPEAVHAMARGLWARPGDLFSADFVAAHCRAAGRPIERLERALDFGCSSGRTLRVLAPAYPEIEWHGCDPNGDAIAWASEHLPGIALQRSGDEPPLPYPDAHFDLVYAISIWSHFGEGAAIAWLEEMRRIVRPGGLLVLTTHGEQSVAYYAAMGERTAEQLAEIRGALYRRGFWYRYEFGEGGDWGVEQPQWGTAFLTPEWLLRHTRADWRLEDFRVGENASNQDVYCLSRRSS